MSKRKKQTPHAARRFEDNPAAGVNNQPGHTLRTSMSGPARLIVAAQFGLGIAALVALYLLWNSIQGGSVAGCGPGSDCDKVLQSRWSKWFGLPVSAFSLAIYAVLFGASRGLRAAEVPQRRQRFELIVVTGSILVLGAAVWYTVLQVAVIHAICPYCMTAHGFGSAAAILLLFARARMTPVASGETGLLQPVAIAASMMAILIGGQVFYEPPGHREGNLASLVSNGAVAAESLGQPTLPDAAVAATNLPANTALVAKAGPMVPVATNAAATSQTSNRVFAIYNGQFKFNLDDVPLIGSPTAPRLMVSLFDYTCHHCRTMHERLLEVWHTWSNELAIIVLPMPLDPQCNPTMNRPHPDHINACFFGRLGLAVVRANRSKSASFDEFVFKPERPPGTNEAMMFAEQLVGADALKRALADPWVEAQLRQGVAIYEISYRAGQGSMPQSIIGNRIAVGLMRKEDLDRILGEEFGLKAPGK